MISTKLTKRKLSISIISFLMKFSFRIARKGDFPKENANIKKLNQ